MALGDAVICAIEQNRKLACFGYDGDGVDQAPACKSKSLALDEGHACAVRANGPVRCWVYDNAGQTDVPPGPQIWPGRASARRAFASPRSDRRPHSSPRSVARRQGPGCRLGSPQPDEEETMGERATGYTVATREEALDFMASYPGYGEQRWYSDALGTEQVSFSWRRMPPGTGGRGSYGHRHPGMEEVYFVARGTVTFKVGDDVFEAGAQTAVRMTGEAFYSVHNDTDAEAELVIFSERRPKPPIERSEGFWP